MEPNNTEHWSMDECLSYLDDHVESTELDLDVVSDLGALEAYAD